MSGIERFFGAPATSKRRAPDSGDEQDRPGQPAALKKAKGDAVASGEDKDKKIEWLVSLTDDEASAVNRIMRQSVQTVRTSTIPAADRTRIQALQASDCTEGRNGHWYVNFTSHTVMADSKGSAVDHHSRWQFDLGAKGAASVVQKLKAAVSRESYTALQAIVPAGAAKRAVKITAHHVAYNATSRRGDAPLTHDLGKGSSVDHACNTAGCIEGSHLSLCTKHVDNLARQRCKGVLLVTFRGAIVQERPCDHAEGSAIGGTFLERLQSSCRRVCLMELDEQAAQAVASMVARDLS